MSKGCWLLLCLLTACSGSKMLDNKTAEERVKFYLNSDKSYFSTEVGRVGADCGTAGSKGHEFSLGVTPSNSDTTRVAEAAGYLSVTPDGAGFWKMELTEKAKADGVAKFGRAFVQKGCDYKMVDLTIATPELIKVIGVTADENAPEVEYYWRWKATDLGRALQEDGKAYALLSQFDRELMEKYSIYGHHMPIPLPPENLAQKDVMKFKKYTDGWRQQRPHP